MVTSTRSSSANDRRKLLFSNIIKRIERFQVLLRETSDFHKRRDLKELEIYVRQVATILDEVLSPQAIKALEFDMAMACRWITYLNEIGRAKVEKEKPELNTEDLDSQEYFY